MTVNFVDLNITEKRDIMTSVRAYLILVFFQRNLNLDFSFVIVVCFLVRKSCQNNKSLVNYITGI